MKLPPGVCEPRSCFSLGCHNRSPTEAEIVVFGGLYESSNVPGFHPVLSDTILFYLGTCILMPHWIVCSDRPVNYRLENLASHFLQV